jgi:branched-chain amino acid:cation transporter, LIVCS family
MTQVTDNSLATGYVAQSPALKKSWLVISTGFALFSMFFGSGNLVFPINVGKESEGHFLLAALGILLTGVIVPFLGVFGMMLFKGDIQSFFSCFGKRGTFWFSLLALALMGPFGVFARCLTVAHGALQLLLPEVSLVSASLVMCVFIYLLAVNKNRIIPVLGTWLTPLLLLAISAIAFFGLKQAGIAESTSLFGWSALKNGFFQGYQTMDLLAAFFFSTFVISQLQNSFSGENQERALLKTFTKASIVGGALLSFVYLALVMLGWVYADLLSQAAPQEMLGKIAMAALGSMAAPCVCIAVVLACLTTAIVLASLFADFLKKEVMQEKLSHKLSLFITIGIGFFVSTLEFAGIARFIGPILELTYPALIVLTLLNIAHKLWGVKISHWPVTVTVVAKLCML